MPYAILMAVIAICTLIWGEGDAFDKGWAALQRGDSDAAIALFDEATRSKDLSMANKGRAFNNLGVAWLAKGEIERAAVQFDTAARFLPQEAAAQQNRALVQGSMRLRGGFARPDTAPHTIALARTSAFGLPTIGAIREKVVSLLS